MHFRTTRALQFDLLKHHALHIFLTFCRIIEPGIELISIAFQALAKTAAAYFIACATHCRCSDVTARQGRQEKSEAPRQKREMRPLASEASRKYSGPRN